MHDDPTIVRWRWSDLHFHTPYKMPAVPWLASHKAITLLLHQSSPLGISLLININRISSPKHCTLTCEVHASDYWI